MVAKHKISNQFHLKKQSIYGHFHELGNFSILYTVVAATSYTFEFSGGFSSGWLPAQESAESQRNAKFEILLEIFFFFRTKVRRHKSLYRHGCK